MGLFFIDSLPFSTTTKPDELKQKEIKESQRSNTASKRLTLKRLTPANRRYLISLGFKVRKN